MNTVFKVNDILCSDLHYGGCRNIIRFYKVVDVTRVGNLKVREVYSYREVISDWNGHIKYKVIPVVENINDKIELMRWHKKTKSYYTKSHSPFSGTSYVITSLYDSSKIYTEEYLD